MNALVCYRCLRDSAWTGRPRADCGFSTFDSVCGECLGVFHCCSDCPPNATCLLCENKPHTEEELARYRALYAIPPATDPLFPLAGGLSCRTCPPGRIDGVTLACALATNRGRCGWCRTKLAEGGANALTDGRRTVYCCSDKCYCYAERFLCWTQYVDQQLTPEQEKQWLIIMRRLWEADRLPEWLR